MTSHVLHLGDCLDPLTGLASLPDKSVDHVICDPPYSEKTHSGFAVSGRIDGARDRAALGFGHMTPEVARLVALEVCRVARRWILIFSDELAFGGWVSAVEAARGEYVRRGTWVKGNPMPQLTGDRPAPGTEDVVIAHAERPPDRSTVPQGKRGGAYRARLRWNGGGRPALYFFNAQEGGREHPTQKPLALMEALVRDFTDAGETILDPFAGSGTTGVACKRLGRSFIGFERDPKYHAIAEKRIAATREQLGLWSGAA